MPSDNYEAHFEQNAGTCNIWKQNKTIKFPDGFRKSSFVENNMSLLVFEKSNSKLGSHI